MNETTMNDTLTMYRTTMPSPVGELTLVADDTALRTILFPSERRPSTTRIDATRCRSTSPATTIRCSRSPRTSSRSTSPASRTEFDVPLAPEGTPFQLQAWSVLRSIPFGSTMSYGEQAAALGDRRRARAVGAANGRNPIPIIVPCHRVVGSNGHLTGFGGGIDAKAWLLDHERFVSFAG